MTYDKSMEDQVLAAILDLRIALGELQATLVNIDQAARKLMAVQLDALESKTGQLSGGSREDKKRGLRAWGKLRYPLIAVSLKLRRSVVKIWAGKASAT